MPDAQPNAVLNELLIQAYRSLLQYTIESWPWTDPDEDDEQRAIDEMARAQREVVARVAEYLDRKGKVVDFGTYPDWSMMHFVALDYLLAKLIADEEQLVAAIEREEAGLKADPEASALAFDLLHLERRNLERLRQMAAARKAPAAV